jgi:hypothetical protein
MYRGYQEIEAVMFQFEHPEDYVQRISQEEARRDRRIEQLRALRGSVPPFSTATDERLTASLREPQPRRILAGHRA